MVEHAGYRYPGLVFVRKVTDDRLLRSAFRGGTGAGIGEHPPVVPADVSSGTHLRPEIKALPDRTRNFTSAASIWNLSGAILPLWGIEVVENSHLGLIYIRGEQIVGKALKACNPLCADLEADLR